MAINYSGVKEDGVSTGVIASVASVGGVAIIGAAVFVLYKKRQAAASQSPSDELMVTPAHASIV
jgi:LPXTG-motif cell wall-anchored protein